MKVNIKIIYITIMCLLATNLFAMDKIENKELKNEKKRPEDAGSAPTQEVKDVTAIGDEDEQASSADPVPENAPAAAAEAKGPLTIKTQDENYVLTIPEAWLRLLTAVTPIVEAQKAYARGFSNALDDFFGDILFTSQKQFDAFRKALKLVYAENQVLSSNQKRLPRVFAQSITDNEISKITNREEIEQLLGIANGLGFAELRLACALYLTTDQKDADLLNDFNDFIAYELRVKNNKIKPEDSVFFAEHGFLPTWTLNKDDDLAGDEKDAGKLWDIFSPDPRGNEFIKQLPQSTIKAVLVTRVIEENCAQPGFMVSDWTKFLTQKQIKEINVVEKLEAKAHAFVGAKTDDQKELKSRFDALPENFFKMLVRKAYSKIYSGKSEKKYIDDVMIERIFDGFGTTNQVNWGHCNITSLDGYQDLLIVWNTIKRIASLNLVHNKLTTATITQLPALTGLFISFNKLTTVTLPATMPALRLLYLTGNKLPTIMLPTIMPALKELSLSYNELTTVPIPQLPALEDLELNNNNLTTVPIPLLPALQRLDLSNNQLNDAEKSRIKAIFRFAKFK